jgi:hypothetical protein
MTRMKTVLMMVAMSGAAWLSPAAAAPPTVTPSPGYDARLQEERTLRVVQAPLHREPRLRYVPPAHRYKRHH